MSDLIPSTSTSGEAAPIMNPDVPVADVAEAAEAAPMSKSMIKRIARKAAAEAARPARRAAEKAKKKGKKAVKQQEKRKLAELGIVEERIPKVRKVVTPVGDDTMRVVVDLAFDSMMLDKEIKSMNTQLAYCHSANRGSSQPVKVLYSSFSGRLRQRMESIGSTHEKWKGIEYWEEPYEGLWQAAEETVKQPEAGAGEEGEGEKNAVASSSKITIGAEAGKPRSTCARSDVVYLTGDSPNIITSFESNKTYILGGIVDRNRYKMLCYDKAVAQGVAHAALPIAEFMPEMKTRYVLTVNQVFEIMLKWREMGDWEMAFKSVMPTRKLKIDENAAPAGGGAANVSKSSETNEPKTEIELDEEDEEEEEEEYDADAAEELALNTS